MRKHQDIATIFSQALKIGLLSKYKKVPSSGFIAKEFNLRAKQTEPITTETARRWTKGLCVPEIEKLSIISEWLDIDISTLISINHTKRIESFKSEKIALQDAIENGNIALRSLIVATSELNTLLDNLKKNL